LLGEPPDPVVRLGVGDRDREELGEVVQSLLRVCGSDSWSRAPTRITPQTSPSTMTGTPALTMRPESRSPAAMAPVRPV